MERLDSCCPQAFDSKRHHMNVGVVRSAQNLNISQHSAEHFAQMRTFAHALTARAAHVISFGIIYLPERAITSLPKTPNNVSTRSLAQNRSTPARPSPASRAEKPDSAVEVESVEGTVLVAEAPRCRGCPPPADSRTAGFSSTALRMIMMGGSRRRHGGLQNQPGHFRPGSARPRHARFCLRMRPSCSKMLWFWHGLLTKCLSFPRVWEGALFVIIR
jgi:hypothetical protein